MAHRCQKEHTMTNSLSLYSADEDFASVRREDIITSRIRLQQATSDEVTSGVFSAGVWGVEGGEVIAARNTTFAFIPAMFWHSWVEFNPDRNAPKDKMIISRSIDPSGPLAAAAGRFEQVINPENQRKMPRVTETYNFVGLCPGISGGYDRLFLVAFQRSAHAVGKQFLNRLMNLKVDGKRANIWMHKWDIGAKFVDEGPQRKYYVPVIGSTPVRVPEADYSTLAGIASKLKDQRMAMMERELEREADAPTTSTSTDASPF